MHELSIPVPSLEWQLDSVVTELQQERSRWRVQQGRKPELAGRELPSREGLQQVLKGLSGALFPLRLGPMDLNEDSENFYVGYTLHSTLNQLYAQVKLELEYEARYQSIPLPPELLFQRARALVQGFANALPRLRRILDSDVAAAYAGDPAARSVDEVLLCYPGITAVIHYRIAHELYRAGLPLLARLISEIAHSATGIDIHPGAQIGGSFFIDHGTGVVIGETAILGERVRLYQAVTLGAKRFVLNASGRLEKGLARHPILEDDVVIYAGATVLGRITIGRGSTIGGNVWLTRSVPAASHITQANVLSLEPVATTPTPMA